jgi:hypothetical protein
MIRANQLIRGQSRRARAQFRIARDKNMSTRAKKNSIATRNRHVSFCNAPTTTRARHGAARDARDGACAAHRPGARCERLLLESPAKQGVIVNERRQNTTRRAHPAAPRDESRRARGPAFARVRAPREAASARAIIRWTAMRRPSSRRDIACSVRKRS